MANDPPKVKVIHPPTKFAPTLGCASPWDNNNFAFASNMGAGNQIMLVRWPDIAFTCTVLVRVPTTAKMINSWTAAQGADCLGPFDANDLNTEEVCTRFAMAVPPAYAEFVMQCQKFTSINLQLILYLSSKPTITCSHANHCWIGAEWQAPIVRLWHPQ